MSDLFAKRRDGLQSAIGAGVAIFAAPPMAVRNGDVEHPFRQNSDLYYLSGFREPGAVLVIAPEHPEHQFVLFVRPRNKEQETWTGRRAGVEGAVERFGADVAYPIAELPEKLPEYLNGADTLYYDLGVNRGMDDTVLEALQTARRKRRYGTRAPNRIEEPHPLHEMRLIKTPAELDRIRKAATITADAHIASMRGARPGMHEFEIESLINHTFRRAGAAGPGYGTIVAHGDNATILHYTENEAPLVEGQLLLIDAGAEYDFYTADVTRTFPVGARFSTPQREVYEVVLAAQLAAIDHSCAGNTFDSVHEVAVRKLTEGMVDIGLLKGEVDGLIENGDYKAFYMHRTGHWLGMDVHDVGAYAADGESRALQPGMVMTVEPGLYIDPDFDGDIPEHFRGIGVRIEDDVLITPDGAAPEVLTAEVPKGVAEVEALTTEAAGA